MDIINKAVNTIRKLALNMVKTAGSGHTGIILGASPLLYSIYQVAKVNPKEPEWLNRDRVVLSSGHGSAMLYATLHLMGYAISIDDMREFRTLGSITPGHPEVYVTPGVDCSTGALGQGFANAVGFAIAEKHLSAKYNRPNMPIIDHYTYVLCGDGDLMEGVSYESAALAGKHQLNKLIVLYDSNQVTLDDTVNATSIEDVHMRFMAMGWNVLEVDNQPQNIINCINSAKSASNTKPTIIICNTIIGQGSQYAGLSKAHGNPFQPQEFDEIISQYGISMDEFKCSLDVHKHFYDTAQRGIEEYNGWVSIHNAYMKKYKNDYNDLFGDKARMVADAINNIKWKEDSISTREAGHRVLNEVAKRYPNILGGCADLSTSTMAFIREEGNLGPDNLTARNIAFGVREHAMSAICNGITLHGGLRGFASTFLIFSDYMRYSMRMSALMDIPTLYILTHDSIAVGQDGPTHEPVEQIESLRLIPNLTVFRPADARETVGAMQWYLENDKPVVFALSRQKLPILNNSSNVGTSRGGYIISMEPEKELNAILIASGSEVDIAVRTQKLLHNEGYSVRVVSMPSRQIFEAQSVNYKESVLPSYFPSKMAIEAGVTSGWYSIVGKFGEVVGVNTFGESGTQTELYDLFGLTVTNLHTRVKALIKRNKTKNIDI